MRKEIERLKHGEHFVVREADYGKAEIWRLNDCYILFEVPLFGGEPIYTDTFTSKQVEDIIYTINSWT